MLGKYSNMRSIMQSYRRFASMSSVSGVNDLMSKDAASVAQYVKEVADKGDASHAAIVDEYFRKQFRKMSHTDAHTILSSLATTETDGPAACLQTSFWTWETLEEAVYGKTSQFSEEDF